jgi:hypothetical protein
VTCPPRRKPEESRESKRKNRPCTLPTKVKETQSLSVLADRKGRLTYVCYRFQLVSVRLDYQLVSVSFNFRFSFLVYCHIDFSLRLLLRFQVSSYRYVSLSVSKVCSLERGGVSDPIQGQVDR